MITATSAGPAYLTRFSDGLHEGLADTTPDKGGAGAGFRPHDLLASALACCINMTVRMYAERKQVVLDSVTTQVDLDRSDPESPVFRYTVDVQGTAVTEEFRKRIAHIVQACPVHKTLSLPARFETAG
jgi:putative redox protein